MCHVPCGRVGRVNMAHLFGFGNRVEERGADEFEDIETKLFCDITELGELLLIDVLPARHNPHVASVGDADDGVLIVFFNVTDEVREWNRNVNAPHEGEAPLGVVLVRHGSLLLDLGDGRTALLSVREQHVDVPVLGQGVVLDVVGSPNVERGGNIGPYVPAPHVVFELDLLLQGFQRLVQRTIVRQHWPPRPGLSTGPSLQLRHHVVHFLWSVLGEGTFREERARNVLNPWRAVQVEGAALQLLRRGDAQPRDSLAPLPQRTEGL
mmetsp:Transcript_26501/g.74073  ORF Transcript_26501/g.74073 Transcript_26501/m.74073 type:complete len:266 (+) Transcript_26501:110-907(+)